MTELTPEQIAELKSQHGDRLWCETTEDGVDVVLRAPKRSELSRFIDEISADEGSRASAMKKFVEACVVYPEDRKAVTAVFDRWPGLIAPMLKKLREMAGGKAQLEGKEL